MRPEKEIPEGGKTRYLRMRVFDKMADLGMSFPKDHLGDFSFAWDADLGRGRFLFKETLLAKIYPFQKEQPELAFRNNLPERAKEKVRAMLRDVLDFMPQVEEASRAVRERARIDAAEKDAPKPSFAARLMSASGPREIFMGVPIRSIGRALSGVAAIQEQADLSINTTGELILKAGQRNFSFVPDGPESVKISVMGSATRLCSEEQMRKILEEGAQAWGARFSSRRFGAAAVHAMGLEELDVHTVQDVTSRVTKTNIRHVLRIGDLEISGYQKGGVISIGMGGCKVLEFKSSYGLDARAGAARFITPDLEIDHQFVFSRNVLTALEMRWRCDQQGLNPADYPKLENIPDLR